MNIDATRISDIQQATFFDTGSIDTYTETLDSLNSITKSWTTGSTINCGFSWKGGAKVYRDGYIVESENAQIRIPPDTIVSKLDHFTLISKSGFTLSPSISFGIESIGYGVGILILGLKVLKV